MRKSKVVTAIAVTAVLFAAQPAWALVFGGTTTDRLDRIEQQTTAILAKLGGTTSVAPSTTVAATTTVAPSTTVAATSTTAATTTVVATTTAAPTTVAATTTMAMPTTAPGTTVPVAGLLFSEPFNTSDLSNISMKVHAPANFFSGLTFQGDHDANCGNTMTTRTLTDSSSVPEHMYWCNGHLMTAMNTTGYVSITMSPKDATTGRARVFPATANRICWDQTLTDMGGRKWIQLAVISASRFAANGFKEGYIRPGFEAPAGDVTSAVMGADDFMFLGTSSYEFYRGQDRQSTDWGFNQLNGVTDKMTRYKTCITDNRNGTITRTQARPDGTVNTITDTGAFPAGPRIFVIEDESYHPDKTWQDEGFVRVVQDGYTWHWDNITVSAT